MYDIFISYSSKETEQAKELCALLEEAGLPCWIAPRDVLGADRSAWPPSIAQAVRNARLMVILLSKNADKSAEVLREVTIAARHRVSVITVNIDGADMVDLEYHLCTTQMLTPENGCVRGAAREILSAVRAVIGGPASLPSAMAEPMLDIYGAGMDKIGTALRSGVHAEGLWHKTLHCWFVSEWGGRPVVWFQKRSGQKADFPGLLDITAGRHLNEAETDREAVGRIVDELGVPVDFGDVEYLGVRTCVDHIGAYHNREFNSVYLYRSPYAPAEFRPRPEEVSGVAAVDADDGLRLFDGAAEQISARGIFQAGRPVETFLVSEADFVPHSGGYYQTIFQRAKDYLNGRRHLAI